MKLKLFISNSFDVYRNIAIECALAKTCPENTQILYLWSNENAVVIGKHQLAGAECDYKRLYEDKGKLARRLSGGGAVYHDIHNLCFSFISRSDIYDQKTDYNIIAEGINSFGLVCAVSGRNDIEIDGKKFSGNAFYTQEGIKVHHGTLLVNTDISLMEKYLRGNAEKLKGHGVSSMPSRVVNLASLCPFITKEALCKSIIQAAEKAYGKGEEIDISSLYGLIENYKILLSSNRWLFGFGKYQNCQSKRFSWGDCQVHYSVEKGVICKLSIITDCLDGEKIDDITDLLVGESLPLAKSDDGIYNDIISLIK